MAHSLFLHPTLAYNDVPKYGSRGDVPALRLPLAADSHIIS
jgi:hypothetical protein